MDAVQINRAASTVSHAYPAVGALWLKHGTGNDALRARASARHYSARTERDASLANASRGLSCPSITAQATSVIGIAT